MRNQALWFAFGDELEDCFSHADCGGLVDVAFDGLAVGGNGEVGRGVFQPSPGLVAAGRLAEVRATENCCGEKFG